MSEPLRGMKALPVAWVVLAAAFCMHMVFLGIHFAFGVFLRPVAKDFQWSRGAPAQAKGLPVEVAARADL